MDAVTFAERIGSLRRETTDVECKSGCSANDRSALPRVARAAMAMSNRARGGVVVIGISENAQGLQFDGVSKADLASWVPDHVADRLFNFTDPPIRFELSVVQFDQKSFVVLEVAEFDMVPVICKRSYPGVLVEGAIYVRPRRKPESVAVPTLADMRDLVELASEKLARRMIAQAERLGLTSATPVPADHELYRSEAPDLLA